MRSCPRLRRKTGNLFAVFFYCYNKLVGNKRVNDDYCFSIKTETMFYTANGLHLPMMEGGRQFSGRRQPPRACSQKALWLAGIRPLQRRFIMSESRALESMKEAVAIARGEMPGDACQAHIPSEVDVKAICQGLGLSQASFAARFGLSRLTLRNWEQGKRLPAAARAYLKVIEKAPDTAYDALTEGRTAAAGGCLKSSGNETSIDGGQTCRLP